MSGKNLRDFLTVLRRERALVDVEAPVDPHLELAEIHRRVIAADGPALFFRNVIGAKFPVVTNLFGSSKRVELAFGARPRELIARAVSAFETLMPPTWDKLWGMRDLALSLGRIGTRKVNRAPILQHVARDATLNDLPIITCWPRDGGPFITLPLVYTESTGGKTHNLGIYRMQRYGARELGMHWQIAKGGGFHYAEAEAAGQALPVTVFLGGPPALMLAAIAPLPENVGELLLASLLLGEKLDVVEERSYPHRLVAEAEFALIGHVPPRERRPEGPFGDHYGYYSLAHDFPVFHLDCVARRSDAIYPATVVGKPRQEDFYIGDFLQEMLSPLFPLVMPGVRSLWSYGETGYHSLAAAVVRERYAREAMVSAFRILGEGQLSLTKFLLVTDTPRDLRDFRALLTHILARARFERDLFIFDCVSMDTLDYTGPRLNEGSKGVLMGLGAPIRELPGEYSGELPAEITRAEVYCPGCLVLEGVKYEREPGAPSRVCAWPGFSAWPLLVLVDDARSACRTDARFLWTVFTRMEPAADIHARALTVARNHPAFTAPIAFDARHKSRLPEELFADPKTALQVSNRWNEYFPQGVPMGDSGSGHLG